MSNGESEGPNGSAGRRAGFAVIGWVFVILQLANLARHAWLQADTGYPPGWDLRVYQAAAQVVAQGQSPYGPESLSGVGSSLPYTYSPLLKGLLPAFLGDADVIRGVYVGTAIVSLLLAIFVLIRGLGLSGWRAAGGAWLVVGGGLSGLNLDFQAGNVTAFEMLPATLVLVGIWRRHPLILAIGMAALCLAKPTWLILALVPLLLDTNKGGLGRMVVAGLAGLAPLALSLLLFPGLTSQWLANASLLRESFNINPCLRELFAGVFLVAHLPGSDLLWVICAIAVLAGIFRLRKSVPDHLLPAVLVTFVLFAPLFFPRMKPYSYAILGMLVALLLTYDGRALRQLALPIVLVSFPYLISYDHDTARVLENANRQLLPIGGWPMLLTTVAGVLVLRWIRQERRVAEPSPHSDSDLTPVSGSA